MSVVMSVVMSGQALGELPLSPSVYAMIADQHGRVRGPVGPSWAQLDRVGPSHQSKRWKQVAQMAVAQGSQEVT